MSFARDWNEYKDGFGDPDGNFWLGNEIIHRLTTNRPYTLRVELMDWSGETKYAEYGEFSLSNECRSYRLTVTGKLIHVIIHMNTEKLAIYSVY